MSMRKITQSYCTTAIKGGFTLVETRILVALVAQAQPVIARHKAEQNVGSLIDPRDASQTFTFNLADIAPNGHHYEDVLQALRALQTKSVEWYNSVTSEWCCSTIVYNVSCTRNTGRVKVHCAEWVLQMLLDFTKGFTRYDLDAIFTLKSAYSMRFYMLSCSLSKPLTYSVDFLREWLGLQEVYGQTRDFIKRVVEPARAELETKKLNGFRYDLQRQGNKISGLTMYPIRRQLETADSITAKAPVSTWCPAPLRDFLVRSCLMTATEIASNKRTLFKFSQVPEWPTKLQKIVERQRKKGAPKAYIIGAMRAVIREEAKPKP